MWAHSPDTILQVATGLHRERIARADAVRTARPARIAASRRRTAGQRWRETVQRGLASLRRDDRHRSVVPSPCPTGTC